MKKTFYEISRSVLPECSGISGRWVGAFLSLVAVACVAFLGRVHAGEKPPVVMEPLKPVPITKADHTIGNGSPAGVTEAALHKAFKTGGKIVFNTGGQPVTVRMTKQLYMSQTAKPIVLDGLGLVTLDGDEKTRIIMKGWKTEMTVQRLRFVNARAPKSGAAIMVENWDGRLTVIDCQFENCKTTEAGPDQGGGAIRPTGQKHFAVSGCTFNNCAGSNGGAICTLGCQLTVINCSFTNNTAFGYGGGKDARSRGGKGMGGIGGAIYVDGVDQNADKKQLYISGCVFKNNKAGDHGGAIFGYTRPNQQSVSVYNACIFENNQVTGERDMYLGFAGGIYTQNSILHVLNCTFGKNKCPKLGSALFIASKETKRIADCEFHGNEGRDNTRPGVCGGDGAAFGKIVDKKLPKSPAEIYLGRYPGPAKGGSTGSAASAILGNAKVKHCAFQATALTKGGSISPILRILDRYAKKGDQKGKEAAALAKAARSWVAKEAERMEKQAESKPARTTMDLNAFIKRIGFLPEYEKMNALLKKLKAEKGVPALIRILQDLDRTRQAIERSGKSGFTNMKLAGTKKALEKLVAGGKLSASATGEAKGVLSGLR